MIDKHNPTQIHKTHSDIRSKQHLFFLVKWEGSVPDSGPAPFTRLSTCLLSCDMLSEFKYKSYGYILMHSILLFGILCIQIQKTNTCKNVRIFSHTSNMYSRGRTCPSAFFDIGSIRAHLGHSSSLKQSLWKQALHTKTRERHRYQIYMDFKKRKSRWRAGCLCLIRKNTCLDSVCRSHSGREITHPSACRTHRWSL